MNLPPEVMRLPDIENNERKTLFSSILHFIWKVQLFLYGNHFLAGPFKCFLIVVARLLSLILVFYPIQTVLQMVPLTLDIFQSLTAASCPYFNCTILKDIPEILKENKLTKPRRFGLFICAAMALILSTVFQILGSTNFGWKIFPFLCLQFLMAVGEISFLLTLDPLTKTEWIREMAKFPESITGIKQHFLSHKEALSLPFFLIFSLNTIVGTFLVGYTIDLVKYEAPFLGTLFYTCFMFVKLIYLGVLADDLFESKEEYTKLVW